MKCPYCRAEMTESDRAHVLACRIAHEKRSIPEMPIDTKGLSEHEPYHTLAGFWNDGGESF